MSGNLESVLDAIQRNADTSARLLVAAEAIRNAQEAPAAPASGGHAIIQVNAGGAGLWISVLCSVVSVMCALAVFVLFVNLDRKVDRAIDYQQANYRNAK
jgi:hypothetical protein